jgi:hypothetical protein
LFDLARNHGSSELSNAAGAFLYTFRRDRKVIRAQLFRDVAAAVSAADVAERSRHRRVRRARSRGRHQRPAVAVARAHASSSRTSASVVGRKSLYQIPTAMNGSGIHAQTM